MTDRISCNIKETDAARLHELVNLRILERTKARTLDVIINTVAPENINILNILFNLELQCTVPYLNETHFEHNRSYIARIQNYNLTLKIP